MRRRGRRRNGPKSIRPPRPSSAAGSDLGPRPRPTLAGWGSRTEHGILPQRGGGWGRSTRHRERSVRRLSLAQRFLLGSLVILLVGMTGIGLWVARQIEDGV